MKQYNVNIIKEGRYAVVYLPFDPKTTPNKALGTHFASGTINCIPFRNKLLSKGKGQHFMLINKEMQKVLGYAGDDAKTYIMEIDDEEKVVDEKENKVSMHNNEVLQNIKTRISVRRFTSQEVSNTDLNTILNAGFEAPSAHNYRPWQFIVVKDKNTLKLLAESGSIHKKLLARANVAIIVCGDVSIQGTRELLINDVSAATQNMLLAIHSLNLGGVWLGMTFNGEYTHMVINTLNLPPKIIPLAIIALGHPDEKREPKERFESEKIHYEKW